MQEMQVQSIGWEDPLEKEMATHSSILAWKIPWIEERDRLQPTVHGLQRVGYNLVTKQHFLNTLCTFVKAVTSVRNVLPPAASTNQQSEPR